MNRTLCFALLSFAIVIASAQAQERTLAEFHKQAIQTDPRLRQLELEAEQTELRLRNLGVERRPSFSVEGQAQYQSDVVEFPFAQPGGAQAPSPPRDTYDAHVRIEQRLLDPAARARNADERARLAESQAAIHTTLFGLRQEVNEAFFASALLQEQEAQIDTSITDLDARLEEARDRVRAGAALPSEAASIEAALLRRRQDAAQIRGARKAALARLSELTGTDMPPEEKLVLPDLAASVREARSNHEQLRNRPEYEQFLRTRERLEARKLMARAQEQPRLTAYGRVGYGKPGLNFLSNDFDAYAVAGIRVQWQPWNWGTTHREQRIAELQQEAIALQEAAFTRSINRAIQNDLARLDELEDVLALDDRVLTLREEIERETRARYREQVVTAAEYIDRQTDVLEARLAAAAHRVELAQARARFLTLLGQEVR